MKRIAKYCADAQQLAQAICDLYAEYDTVTIHSTPALELAGYYSFGVSVDGSEFDNAVYIGGHCYQLTETDDRDRCEGCALRDCCGNGNPRPCDIFKDECGANTHFENAKIY